MDSDKPDNADLTPKELAAAEARRLYRVEMDRHQAELRARKGEIYGNAFKNFQKARKQAFNESEPEGPTKWELMLVPTQPDPPSPEEVLRIAMESRGYTPIPGVAPIPWVARDKGPSRMEANVSATIPGDDTGVRRTETFGDEVLRKLGYKPGHHYLKEKRATIFDYGTIFGRHFPKSFESTMMEEDHGIPSGNPYRLLNTEQGRDSEPSSKRGMDTDAELATRAATDDADDQPTTQEL